METENYLKRFRNRLMQLQNEYDVSSRALSTGIGSSSNYIQGVISGKSNPSLSKIFEICDFLEISPSDLFDFDQPIEADSFRFQSLGRKLTPKERSYFIEVMEGYLVLKEGREDTCE